MNDYEKYVQKCRQLLAEIKAIEEDRKVYLKYNQSVQQLQKTIDHAQKKYDEFNQKQDFLKNKGQAMQKQWAELGQEIQQIMRSNPLPRLVQVKQERAQVCKALSDYQHVYDRFQKAKEKFDFKQQPEQCPVQMNNIKNTLAFLLEKGTNDNGVKWDTKQRKALEDPKGWEWKQDQWKYTRRLPKFNLTFTGGTTCWGMRIPAAPIPGEVEIEEEENIPPPPPYPSSPPSPPLPPPEPTKEPKKPRTFVHRQGRTAKNHPPRT